LKFERNVTLCRLPWHWAKFVDGKRQDKAPPPAIILEANKKWKV
jgi:hypothetical protein